MSDGRGMAHLLLRLQAVDDGSELAQGLVSLLVILDLGSDEVGQVAKRLRGVEDLSV